jgi:hypothetical protein
MDDHLRTPDAMRHGRLQPYVGYKDIHHAVRYTELSPERFKSSWEDPALP